MGKVIAGLVIGLGTIVLANSVDKALGLSTKIVSFVGVTPK